MQPRIAQIFVWLVHCVTLTLAMVMTNTYTQKALREQESVVAWRTEAMYGHDGLKTYTMFSRQVRHLNGVRQEGDTTYFNRDGTSFVGMPGCRYFLKDGCWHDWTWREVEQQRALASLNQASQTDAEQPAEPSQP